MHSIRNGGPKIYNSVLFSVSVVLLTRISTSDSKQSLISKLIFLTVDIDYYISVTHHER